MKIYIGKPVKFFSTYDLARKICFWVREDELSEKKTVADKLGDFLTYGFISFHKDFDKKNNSEELKVTFLHNLFILIHNIRSKKQYIKIDSWDTWSVDYTLSPIILCLLQQYRKDLDEIPTHCLVDDQDIPKSFFDKVVVESTKNMEKWHSVVDEMIFAFEQIANDDVSRENEDRINKGLKLFGKYFRYLWT